LNEGRYERIFPWKKPAKSVEVTGFWSNSLEIRELEWHVCILPSCFKFSQD